MLSSTGHGSGGMKDLITDASLSSQEEDRQLQERGRQLLEARRRDAQDFQYSAEDAAILAARGKQVLDQHRRQRRDETGVAASSCSSDDADGGSSPTFTARISNEILTPFAERKARDAQTIAALQAEIAQLRGDMANMKVDRQLNGDGGATIAADDTTMMPRAEADRMKADLITQFNAHMAQCEQTNRTYWEQTMQQHQDALAKVKAEAEATVEDLRRRLADKDVSAASTAHLEGELHSVRMELQQLEDERNTLVSELALSRQALQAAEAELTTAQSSAQGMLDEVQHLQTLLEAADRDRSALETQLEALGSQSSSHREEQQRLAALLEEAQSQLALSEESVQQLTHRVSELEDNAATGNDGNNNNNVNIDANTNPFASSQEALDGEALAEKERQMEELHRTIMLLQNDLNASGQHIMQTEMALDAMQQQLDQERTARARMEEEVNALRHQVEAASTVQAPPAEAAVVVDNPFAHGHDDDDEKESAGPSRELAEAYDRIADLEAQLEAALASEEDIRSSRNVIELDSDEVQRQLDAERAERTRLEAVVAELERQLHGAQRKPLDATSQPAPGHASNPFAAMSDTGATDDLAEEPCAVNPFAGDEGAGFGDGHNAAEVDSDEVQRQLDAERAERKRLESTVADLERQLLAAQRKLDERPSVFSQSSASSQAAQAGSNPFAAMPDEAEVVMPNSTAVTAENHDDVVAELAVAYDRVAELEAQLEAAVANEKDMRSTRNMLQADGDELQRKLDAERLEHQRLELVISNLEGSLRAARIEAQEAIIRSSIPRTEDGFVRRSSGGNNPFASAPRGVEGTTDEDAESSADPFDTNTGAGTTTDNNDDDYNNDHPDEEEESAGLSRELAEAYDRIADLEAQLEAALASEEDIRSSRNVIELDSDEVQRQLDAERAERTRLEAVVAELERQLHGAQRKPLDAASQPAPRHASNPFAAMPDSDATDDLAEEPCAVNPFAGDEIVDLEPAFFTQARADDSEDEVIVVDDHDIYDDDDGTTTVTASPKGMGKLFFSQHVGEDDTDKLPATTSLQSLAAERDSLADELRQLQSLHISVLERESSLQRELQELRATAGTGTDSAVGMETLGRQHADAQNRLVRAEMVIDVLKDRLREVDPDYTLPEPCPPRSSENTSSASVDPTNSSSPFEGGLDRARRSQSLPSGPQQLSPKEVGEVVFDHGDTPEQPATMTRQREVSPQHEELEMEGLGRQYADAQLRLMQGEEERAALVAEVGRLSAKVRELELEEDAPRSDDDDDTRINGNGSVSEQNPFADDANLDGGNDEVVTVEEAVEDIDLIASLKARITELEEQMTDVAEGHEAELMDLAEEAADRLAENSAVCDARVAELEDLLRKARQASPEEGAAPVDADVQSLQSKLAEMTATVEALRIEHDTELMELAEEAAERLAESDAVCDERIAELEDLLRKATQTSSEETPVLLDADVQSLQAQLSKMTATVESLRAEHEAELAAVEEDVAEQMRNHYELLRERLEEQKNHYEGLLVEAAQAVTEAVDSQETQHMVSNDAETAHDELKQEYEKLAARFEQIQVEYEAFQKDTEALRTRAIMSQQEESRHVHDAASQQIQELRKRLDDMSEHVTAAQAEVRERDAALDDAARHVQSLESEQRREKDRLESLLALRVEEVQQLTTANDELTDLLQKGATSVESALLDRQQQLDAANKQCMQLKVEIASTRDQLAQREDTIAALKQTEDAQHQRVLNCETAQRELENQLNEARRALHEEQRSAAVQLEKVQRELQRKENTLHAQLDDSRQRHAAEVQELRTEADRAREELQVAQTLLATQPLESEKQQNQLASLKQQLMDALHSNKQLHDDLRHARNEVQRQHSLLRGLGNSSHETASGDDAAAMDARVNTLLELNETLEEKVRVLTADNNKLMEDTDSLRLEVSNAVRVVDVKEQAMRRQEMELRTARGQVTAMREDLAQRVHGQHALELELAEAHEHAADLTRAYDDLQSGAVDSMRQLALLEHAEGLLTAKMASVPRLLHDYMTGLLDGLNDTTRVTQEERRGLVERCDIIESTAAMAMEEGERQIQAYEAALADAKDEQASLKRVIEDLHGDLTMIEEAMANATAEAKAARAELAEVKRNANDNVFSAQRDLQVAELERADSLNEVSLLKEEVGNAARLFQRQQQRYEARERELSNEVERLSGRVALLESDAKKEKEGLATERAELHAQMEENVRLRDEAVRDARSAQTQLDRALPRLAQLEEEQAQRSAELMDTAQQFAILSKRTSSEGVVTRRHIDELNEALQGLMDTHASLQRSHTTSESMVDRLRTQLQASEQALERAAAQRDSALAELATISSKLKDLETAYARDTNDLQVNLRDTERRLKGFEQRNGVLQQEQQALQDNLHQVQTALDTTGDDLRRVTDDYEALKLHQSRQLESLKQRGMALEHELHQLQQEHQTLSLKHNTLDREHQQSQHEVQRLTQHLDDANGYNQTLNEQLAAQKEAHSSEVAEVKATLSDAYAELNRCRNTIAAAEVRQLDSAQVEHQLRAECAKLKDEVATCRAAVDKTHERLVKEQSGKQETVSDLQGQVAALEEQLHNQQYELRAVQGAAARSEDTITALRRELRDALESAKAAAQEHVAFKEEVAVVKEIHRRERAELQSQLHHVQSAEQDVTSQFAQYKEKMASKVEVLEVSEQSLRREITDLRVDVAQLEEALARTKKGMHSAETHRTRQGQSLKVAEEELLSLRTQVTQDMVEITGLQQRLHQTQADLERAQRDAAAQLLIERTKAEEERRTTCGALQEALVKERQAAQEARAARERALQAMEKRRRDLEEQESVLGNQQNELRELQRERGILRGQLQAIEGTAAQAAEEAGLVPEDGSSAHMTDRAPLEPQAVLDALVDSLLLYRSAASTLDVEGSQVDELMRALRAHRDVMQAVVSLSASHELAITAAPHGNVTPARPPRSSAAGSLAALNRTPAAGSNTPLPYMSGSGPQRDAGAVQQIAQASATFVHRVEAHVETLQQLLRSLVVGMGATGSQQAATSSSSTLRSAARAAPLIKLLVSATTAELHRRTATLTRSLQRIMDGSCNGPLTDTLWVFQEAEVLVLRPFNELLVAADGDDEASRRASAGKAAQ